MAVERGYADATWTRYDCAVFSPEGTALRSGVMAAPEVPLAREWSRRARLVVSLVPERPGYEADPVLLYLLTTENGWQVIGLRRLD